MELKYRIGQTVDFNDERWGLSTMTIDDVDEFDGEYVYYGYFNGDDDYEVGEKQIIGLHVSPTNKATQAFRNVLRNYGIDVKKVDELEIEFKKLLLS